MMTRPFGYRGQSNFRKLLRAIMTRDASSRRAIGREYVNQQERSRQVINRCQPRNHSRSSARLKTASSDPIESAFRPGRS